MAQPNIRPDFQPHIRCSDQEWPVQGLAGDVRYCVHGDVQVLTEPHPQSSVQGPGARWWRDLHPFWNRREYKAAKAALDVAGIPSPTHGAPGKAGTHEG